MLVAVVQMKPICLPAGGLLAFQLASACCPLTRPCAMPIIRDAAADYLIAVDNGLTDCYPGALRGGELHEAKSASRDKTWRPADGVSLRPCANCHIIGLLWRISTTIVFSTRLTIIEAGDESVVLPPPAR